MAKPKRLEKRDIALASLAATSRQSFTPVQVQKLLFLVDRRVSGLIGGPFFNFEPYNYGPFDKSIYGLLENLAADGLVKIEYDSNFRRNTYLLTTQGAARGKEKLKELPPPVVSYIEKLAGFVSKASFVHLVSSIYRAYPEMRVNSVFGRG